MTKQCGRCGQCCVNVAICHSPQKLREYYEKWSRGELAEYGEIWLYYTLLEYKGYNKTKKVYRYRCRALKYDKNGKAKCGIYANRPYMCRQYPNGNFIIHQKDRDGNRTLYPKCTLSVRQNLYVNDTNDKFGWASVGDNEIIKNGWEEVDIINTIKHDLPMRPQLKKRFNNMTGTEQEWLLDWLEHRQFHFGWKQWKGALTEILHELFNLEGLETPPGMVSK